MVGVWYRFDLHLKVVQKTSQKQSAKTTMSALHPICWENFLHCFFATLRACFLQYFRKTLNWSGMICWRIPLEVSETSSTSLMWLWLVRMKNCFELTKWSWLPQTIHPNPNINFKEIIWLGNGVIEVFVELEVNLEVHTVGGWGHEAIASALSLRPGPKFLIKWLNTPLWLFGQIKAGGGWGRDGGGIIADCSQ